MQEIAAAKLWPGPLVTQIEPLTTFYPAEAEHDDYYERNPWSGYCQVVIAPKVAKFRKAFKDRLRQVAAE
jgi:peptide-methionine (S)-S-oxide reductase